MTITEFFKQQEKDFKRLKIPFNFNGIMVLLGL